MPRLHLSDFKRDKLVYDEHERRFCLQREKGTKLQAYNIDVKGVDQQTTYYFKEVYAQAQNRRSADGLYVGSFPFRGRKITFVLVVELEGPSSSFEDAVAQVQSTLEHFCQDFQDPQLADDGVRHHQQAQRKPAPYSAKDGHLVAGVVIGSAGRQGNLANYKKYPIVRLNSRQPIHDKTPLALFEEIAQYTGDSMFWTPPATFSHTQHRRKNKR